MTTAAQVAMREVEIETPDGERLAATVFEPLTINATAPVTVIAAGAAIPRGYYALFARALAEHGRTAVTFDYRGIGGSLRVPIKNCRVQMRDWGQSDVPAVIDYVGRTWPGRPLHWVGHSYGGGFGVGLAPNNDRIARHLGIAVPHGYWREMRAPESWRIGALVGGGLPLLAAMYGYMPGKLTGLGENLPKLAALEWRSWIMSRNSMWDTLPADALAPYATLRAPMRFFCITDDPWATRVAVERMAAAFTGAAEREVVMLGPEQTGGQKVGHIGFFRARFADTLWRHAIAWLDAQA